MLQPHRYVEPISDRRLLATGLRQNRPQTGTTVGKRRQFGVAASADRLKAAPDQRGNFRIGLRDRGENLPTTGRCLDITNVHPQMSLVVRRARICFASGNVNPSLAMSPRSPNGPISTT